jgi:hypothetical protein
MKSLSAIQGMGAALLLLLFTASSAMAAPACKGPNKNDPGCPGAEEPPPPPPEPVLAPGMVDSVTVDWFNQVLVVRGTTLDTAGNWMLGGSPALTNINTIDPGMVEIGFDADLAAEVQDAGSYLLTADGNLQLSIYIEAAIVDPAAVGCPCLGNWSLMTPDWGIPDTDCLEIEGPGANDPADISGTVLSIPGDPLSYPQFPIGASFYPGEPGDSVCRLVQVNADVSLAELVNLPINENQQADCRTALATNVCATITPLP